MSDEKVDAPKPTPETDPQIDPPPSSWHPPAKSRVTVTVIVAVALLAILAIVTLPARRMDETGAARNMILTEDMA